MIAKTLAYVVAYVLFVLPATGWSQIIANGDFETGTYSGWTMFTSNGTFRGCPTPCGSVTIGSFDTTGSGTSLAARFQVGKIPSSLTGPGGGGIFQSFSALAGNYNFNMNIAVQELHGTGNIDAGTFSLLLDGVTVASHPFGFISPLDIERSDLSYTSFLTAGSHELRILMTRDFLAGGTLGFTPQQRIDNVSVTASVPEPETFTLLLIALGLLGFLARGRKQKSA